jgi:hypothetical protein
MLRWSLEMSFDSRQGGLNVTVDSAQILASRQGRCTALIKGLSRSPLQIARLRLYRSSPVGIQQMHSQHCIVPMLEAIRGVDTYMDPVSNNLVQLDHTYGDAWRANNQNAYILTKHPSFNPGQYGIEATQVRGCAEGVRKRCGRPRWVRRRARSRWPACRRSVWRVPGGGGRRERPDGERIEEARGARLARVPLRSRSC